MTSAKRAIPLLLLTAVLVSSCRSEAPEPTPAPTVDPTPGPVALTVEVRDGAVVGGVKRVPVDVGDEVRLSVHSDVADEIHVHGLEKKAAVAAGGTAVIAFTADAPGLFEVELEQRHLKLLELEVR